MNDQRDVIYNDFWAYPTGRQLITDTKEVSLPLYLHCETILEESTAALTILDEALLTNKIVGHGSEEVWKCNEKNFCGGRQEFPWTVLSPKGQGGGDQQRWTKMHVQKTCPNFARRTVIAPLN